METNKLTPIKAIRAKCMECCCNHRDDVRLCECIDCPLYRFRMGKNPNRTMNEEQKKKARETVAKLQESGHFRKKDGVYGKTK